jgi:hypothetical protein
LAEKKFEQGISKAWKIKTGITISLLKNEFQKPKKLKESP